MMNSRAQQIFAINLVAYQYFTHKIPYHCRKKNVALITNKHFPFPHLVFLFFFKFASARMCSPSLLLIEIISVNPPGFNCIFFFVCFVFPFIMLVIAGSYGLIRISSKASFQSSHAELCQSLGWRWRQLQLWFVMQLLGRHFTKM